MLDINKIRHETEAVRTALLKRLPPEKIHLEEIISLDASHRELLAKVEALKAQRNVASKTKPDQATIEKIRLLGEEIKNLDDQVKSVGDELQEKLAELPNLPADDVVAGDKENNQVIFTQGFIPKFDFEPKDHVELATSLGLIDYERGVKIAGSGFWVYTGVGALLEWALLNYFIKFHTKNGYQFMIPPFLLTEESAYTSGHLPKFREDLYWTEDKLCLNATSEMMLGNYFRDEILDSSKLPYKFCAYSACFRREAGSYRKEERGMVRGHQFNKIEMFQYTKSEDSWSAYEEMIEQAKQLLTGLGLHYQVSKLAAGDCSSAMAKTVDLEVYIPSMGIYKEVSSASNALDYQARRGNVRYKNAEGKTEFAHTLNCSGLATSRLIPAIIEQFQQADGSVLVPEVLQEFVGKSVLKV